MSNLQISASAETGHTSISTADKVWSPATNSQELSFNILEKEVVAIFVFDLIPGNVLKLFTISSLIYALEKNSTGLAFNNAELSMFKSNFNSLIFLFVLFLYYCLE
jgi:hypothetical protein